MTVIARHELKGSRENLARSIRKHELILARFLTADTWAASETGIFSGIAFDNAARRAWYDPSDRAILADLELCACLAAAAHAAATAPSESPVLAPAPGDRTVRVTFEHGPPQRLDPPNHWRWGILAARATRNQPALAALAAVGVKSLLGLSRSLPSWFPSEAAALAAAFRLDPAAPELLVEAMQRTDPNEVEPVDRNYLLDVVAPEIEAGFRALQRDHGAFDAVMHRSLQGHHHFYGRDAEGHFHGQLALAPLAMACLGYDLGLRTNVESDYLPRWIVERTPAQLPAATRS